MKSYQRSIGRENAIELAESNWWELCSSAEAVEFQLFTVELCMPLSTFHQKLEEVLGRSVFTHELGMDYDGIVKEFLGERAAPTFDEIMKLIPDEKRIIIDLEEL